MKWCNVVCVEDLWAKLMMFMPSLYCVVKHLTMGPGVLMAVIKTCNNVIKPEKTRSCKWRLAEQCNQ